MAFINGYITRYECPACKCGCQPQLNNQFNKFQYKHPDTQIITINGYPAPCENNGKILEENEIKKVDTPNIVSQTGFGGIAYY